MRAITVRPPWVWATAKAVVLAQLGVDPKLVENRGRRVAAEHIGGDWAIHAGTRWDTDGAEDLRVQLAWQAYWDKPLADQPIYTDLPTGAVVAVAKLADCHEAVGEAPACCCPPWGERWHSGPQSTRRAWHLVWTDVRALPEPVPARGQQSVPWMLPPEVAEQVTAQLAEEVPRGR